MSDNLNTIFKKVNFYSWNRININELRPKPMDIDSIQRLFQYGDGIFESIRVENGKAPLLNWHLERISNSANQFDYHFETNFWQHLSQKLIEFNSHFSKPHRLKLILTRKSDGLYSISNTQTIVLFQYSKINTPVSTSQELNIANSPSDLNHSISIHKTCNALPYIINDRDKKGHVLYDREDCIIETNGSNIYFVKNKEIITPSLAQGCLNGISRKWIIGNYRNVKSIKVKLHHLPYFDACFISNAVSGINHISGIDTIDYKESQIAEKLKVKFLALFT